MLGHTLHTQDPVMILTPRTPFYLQNEVARSVALYRRSLVVLVSPHSRSPAADDGIRISMSEKQCDVYTENLRALLERFDIAYLDLGETCLQERVAAVERAVDIYIEGRPSNTFSSHNGFLACGILRM